MTRAVIKLRSSINANHEVKLTMKSLRLNRVNHCVLVPDGKSYDGMLQKVKDFVTWGEIKTEVLTNMIIKRGRLTGGRPITNQYIKDNTKHDSMIKFAEAITTGAYMYKDLKDVKPLFRLHPPHRGFEGIKRSYNDRGSLGYRGEAINDLILRMLEPNMKPKVARISKKHVATVKVPATSTKKGSKEPAASDKTTKAAPVPKKAKTVEAKVPTTAKKAPVAKKAVASPKSEAEPKKAPVKKKAAPKEESK
jgi:large subunit ribosomal protein L30